MRIFNSVKLKFIAMLVAFIVFASTAVAHGGRADTNTYEYNVYNNAIKSLEICAQDIQKYLSRGAKAFQTSEKIDTRFAFSYFASGSLLLSIGEMENCISDVMYLESVLSVRVDQSAYIVNFLKSRKNRYNKVLKGILAIRASLRNFSDSESLIFADNLVKSIERNNKMFCKNKNSFLCTE